MAYSTIIWDWNGTLLNDVDSSIETMNELLNRRHLPQLTKEQYKNIFGFPVFDYYQELGFDFEEESWVDVAAEFMDGYHAKESSFELFNYSIDILSYFKERGYRQYILSAMKTSSIEKMLNHYKINQFFDGIYGLDHHYADGKIQLGQELIHNQELSPSNCIMFGDTIHDAKVADNLGFNCTLVSQGHQSYERLKSTDYTVIQELSELRNKF